MYLRRPAPAALCLYTAVFAIILTILDETTKLRSLKRWTVISMLMPPGAPRATQ